MTGRLRAIASALLVGGLALASGCLEASPGDYTFYDANSFRNTDGGELVVASVASCIDSRVGVGGAWTFTNDTLDSGTLYPHFYSDLAMAANGVFHPGVGAEDIDGDCLPDMIVPRAENGAPVLLSNQGDGTFLDVTLISGAIVTEPDVGAPLLTDLNGDGHADLLLAALRNNAPTLFWGDGDGTFTPGVAPPMTKDSFSAAAGDYDLDGDLDIVIADWVQQPFAVARERLWENHGDGTFTDETFSSGLAWVTINNVFTPVFTDLNHDSAPDLLLASDFGTTHVLLNDGVGFLENVTSDVITDENGMGSALGDYDNDGDLDWFVSSIYDHDDSEGNWGVTGNRLYRQRGDGTFEDATDEAGVRDGGWGWGSCFQDFDHDGDLDLAQTNGYRGIGLQFIDDQTRFWVNNGDGTFQESATALGVTDVGLGRGVVCMDYDRDGDIDIYLSNSSGDPILYRNDGDKGSFLNVRLRYQAPNLGGVGARVWVRADGKSQVREMRAGSNFISHDPLELHFGLDAATTIDELWVRWPDGTYSIVEDLAVDQFIVVTYEG